MKRLIAFFLFFISLAMPVSADYWKTYRFPCEPDYILSIPSSYHVLYSGMPENSPVLQSLGITTKQAELSLEINNAFALIYSDDYSSFFSIAKFEDNSIYDYDELSSDELDELAVIIGEQLKDQLETNSDIILNSSECFAFESDHARYITIISQITLGSLEQILVQCVTTSNGYQIILTFNCANKEDIITKDMDTFQTIVENFIPL